MEAQTIFDSARYILSLLVAVLFALDFFLKKETISNLNNKSSTLIKLINKDVYKLIHIIIDYKIHLFIIIVVPFYTIILMEFLKTPFAIITIFLIKFIVFASSILMSLYLIIMLALIITSFVTRILTISPKGVLGSVAVILLILEYIVLPTISYIHKHM